MPVDIASLLELATTSELVQIGRKRLQSSDLMRGAVVGVSEHLLIINKVSENITFDGFAILRVRDITSLVTSFKQKPFYKKALELKGLKPESIRGPIDDMPHAIVSYSAVYPLIVFSRERLYPDSVWIGKVLEAKRSGVHVHLIDSAAEFLEKPEFYRYDTITRIEFGGGYEQTLALVAGL